MNRKTLCLLPISILFFMSLSACTHRAAVRPSVSPVAFEMASDRVNASAAVYIYPEVLNYELQVHPSSYQCSAWNYNLEIGDAVRGTVVQVAEASFEKSYPVDSLNETSDFCDFFVTIGLLDCNCTLTFHSSFFSGTADASAELSLKVVLLDKNLKRIDQFVVGHSSRKTGGAGGFCEGGGKTIEAAFQQCLKHISIQLAEKLTHNRKLIVILENK